MVQLMPAVRSLMAERIDRIILETRASPGHLAPAATDRL